MRQSLSSGTNNPRADRSAREQEQPTGKAG